MSDSPPPHSPAPKSSIQSSGYSARFYLILAAMVVAFLVVVLQRNSIRARYWAYQLKQTDDFAEQAYYIACLASIGDAATESVESLVWDSRNEVRMLAIPASQGLTPRIRHELVLYALILDDDEELQASAATAIALSHWKPGEQFLIAISQSPSESTACAAAGGLSRIDSAAAVDALCSIIQTHKSPKVRAQAVESLAGHLQPSLVNRDAMTGKLDPISVMVQALGDSGEFTGKLAAEREIETVSSAVTARKGLRVATSAPSASAARTVASVAAGVLTDLTGETIEPIPADFAAPSRLVERCKSLIAQRRPRLPTTLPGP
ncbi:MAG: HEAT repeat domain-containing protein [Planctomycetia bacterium]|nr:HEAT repeat domain-containing protein [Planctomycetia bacterium]MCC7316019.1 HEAT repeat domain-containing protein [Planctomycetota bacterium]